MNQSIIHHMIAAMLRGLMPAARAEPTRSTAVEPFPVMLKNTSRRVFQVSTLDADEVVLRRYAASIGPVTTRDAQAVVAQMKRDLLAAVRIARSIGEPFIRWEESDYDGYGVVSEARMNRKDEDDDDEDDYDEDKEELDSQ